MINESSFNVKRRFDPDILVTETIGPIGPEENIVGLCFDFRNRYKSIKTLIASKLNVRVEKIFLKEANEKQSILIDSFRRHRYAGSLSILFRTNIQLSGTLGYQKFAQERSMGNKNSYTVAGYYGNVGLDYLVFYTPRNNLYAGLRYCRSSFKNSTTPVSSAEQVIRKDLTAYWWELIIGSEHQLVSNFGLYAGFMIHLKGVGNFETFAPATNYVVPGYGRSVQNVVPSLTLYIKYQISFLKKQITLS